MVLVPHPVLSLLLALTWLFLNGFSTGQLVLGLLVGFGAGWAFGAIEPHPGRLRNPRAMLRLFGIVFVDIIRSNIAVASLILSRGRHGRRKAAFIPIRLTLNNPLGLAALAFIVTATPGTAWIEHDTDTGVLLLHVFDVIDEDDWVTMIRDRYEALLLEIFA